MTRCPSQKPVEGSIEEGRFHEVSRITDAPWAHPLKRREPEFEESGGRLCGLRALRVRNKVRRRFARRARPTRCGTARNNQNKPRSASAKGFNSAVLTDNPTDCVPGTFGASDDPIARPPLPFGLRGTACCPAVLLSFRRESTGPMADVFPHCSRLARGAFVFCCFASAKRI